MARDARDAPFAQARLGQVHVPPCHRLTFEGLLAVQHLHNPGTCDPRFIPVILGGASDGDVPSVFRSLPRCVMPGQIEALCRQLTGEATPSPLLLAPRAHAQGKRVSRGRATLARPRASAPRAVADDWEELDRCLRAERSDRH